MLLVQQAEVERQEDEAPGIQSQMQTIQERQQEFEHELARRKDLETNLQEMREQWVELKSACQGLERLIAELDERSAQLDQVEGAVCPLCGQPLSADDRQALILSLMQQKEQASRLLTCNQETMKQINTQGEQQKRQINDLARLENDLRSASQDATRLSGRLEAIQASSQVWQKEGAVRLAAISLALESGQFALPERAQLAQIDAELRHIGYDPALHEQVRQAEQAERIIEAEMRALEKARATLAPLEREVGDLQRQVKAARKETTRQQEEVGQASASLAAAQAQAPDLQSTERSLLLLQERENILRREAGAAQQLVAVLADLKGRSKDYEARREELARQAGLYKQLERAFGKDGVPALLIEQALPQIEAKANEVLDRLSGGTMSVRFVTQSAYKDKTREDLKETLDIQISDGSGTRDYEMFSGGEAFRVNFAIRLALSEVLAQRAGARLQTLVVDEGFGSQDAQGRQRLIEAINLVRNDFAKILVITHIDELKDAFPNRIEVEKTGRGSMVQVI
jgi:exonuclease SbcC